MGDNDDDEYIPSSMKRAQRKRIGASGRGASYKNLRSRTTNAINHPALDSDDDSTDTELAAMGQDTAGCSIQEKRQLLQALKESEQDLQRPINNDSVTSQQMDDSGGPTDFYLENKKVREEKQQSGWRNMSGCSTSQMSQQCLQASMEIRITRFDSYDKSDENLIVKRGRNEECERIKWNHECATGLTREEHFQAILAEMDSIALQAAKQEGVSSKVCNFDSILDGAVELSYYKITSSNNTHSGSWSLKGRFKDFSARRTVNESSVETNVGLDNNSNYHKIPQSIARGSSPRGNLAGTSRPTLLSRVQSRPARRELIELVICPTCNAQVVASEIENHISQCHYTASGAGKDESDDSQQTSCECGVTIPKSIFKSHQMRCRKKNDGTSKISKDEIRKTLEKDWCSEDEDGVDIVAHCQQNRKKLGKLAMNKGDQVPDQISMKPYMPPFKKYRPDN